MCWHEVAVDRHATPQVDPILDELLGVLAEESIRRRQEIRNPQRYWDPRERPSFTGEGVLGGNLRYGAIRGGPEPEERQLSWLASAAHLRGRAGRPPVSTCRFLR